MGNHTENAIHGDKNHKMLYKSGSLYIYLGLSLLDAAFIQVENIVVGLVCHPPGRIDDRGRRTSRRVVGLFAIFTRAIRLPTTR
jgi:hypothetical protein